MNEIYDLLTKQLQTNEFFTGGALIATLSGLAYYLKGVPKQLERWFWRTFSCRVEISNHDSFYESVKLWLNAQPYSRRSRTLVGSTIKDEDEYDDTINKDTVFTPAPGNHFFRYKKQLLWLNIDREESNQNMSTGERPAPPRETMTFTLIGRKQERVRRLVDDIKLEAENFTKNKAHIYIQSSGYWRKLTTVHKRPVSSIVLPKQIAEGVVKDVTEFRGSKDWYKNLGIPYRRGYLFYGPPGGGKTSFANAIADDLNMNLYVISLANTKISDESFNNQLMDVKPGSIVLLEDIDAMFKGRKNVSKSSLSFSGLLNALDGVSAKEDVCFIMTTNHREHLDPALIRPGRVDVEVYFGYATEEQVRGMIARFYPEYDEECANEFVAKCQGREISMAQLQKHFLKYKSSLTTAYLEIDDLFSAPFTEETPPMKDEDDDEDDEEVEDDDDQEHGTPIRAVPGRMLPTISQ